MRLCLCCFALIVSDLVLMFVSIVCVLCVAFAGASLHSRLKLYTFPGFASGCMASPSAFGRSRALTSTDVLHALAATWHDKWQGGRCGFAHAT